MPATGPEMEREAPRPAPSERPLIVLSERAYDAMMEACARAEAPDRGLVDAYLLYRRRVVSSAR